jgi:guanosine-3',5'-bis(diphosphate) 3'-pyrophosphohydrolase
MTNPPLWHAAADFAAQRHRHQLRKDGITPYIAHPLRVALVVAVEFGCTDPEVLAAAILHDTIEDTETDYEDLSERFGGWVADAVATLTNNKSLPEEEREAEYHRRLATADWRVLLIKVADACENVRDSARGPDGQLAGRCLRKSGKVADLARARAHESPVLARAADQLEKLRRSCDPPPSH